MSQVGESMYAKAVALAQSTSALSGYVAHIADIKEEFSRAPVHLAMSLITLADKGEIDLDALPRIGSKEKETNNPDLFMWRDPSDPDAKEKEISFYVAWSDNTPEGRRIVQEIDWLRRLNTKGMAIDDIPQEFQDRYPNADVRTKRKDKLTDRRGNVRKAWKQAIQVIHQMDDINDLAHVACKVFPGSEPGTWDGEIRIHSTVEGRDTKDYEDYTAGTFLKLDAAKAAEGGGTLNAVKATIAREGGGKGKGKGGGDKGGGIPALASIETPETLDRVMVAAHSYLDKAWSDKKGDEYARLLKAVTTNKALNKTLGDIKGMLDTLFGMPKIASLYATTCEEEANATRDLANKNSEGIDPVTGKAVATA